ncbi:MAG: TRAP transporter small permease subunit [Dongiaceae bacterium]
MSPLRRFVDVISDLAGWGLLVYCAMVSADIASRRLVGVSLQGIDEIGGYTMAIMVALGFSAALLGGSHIRIDILLPHFPRAVSHWLNIAGFLGLLSYASFLSWSGWTVFAQSYAMKAVSPTSLTPLVIPQIVWLSGLVLFLAAALACFVACARMPADSEQRGV